MGWTLTGAHVLRAAAHAATGAVWTAATLVLALATACATGAPRPTFQVPANAAPTADRIVVPRTGAAMQRALAEALWALRVDEPAHAARLLHGILKSDHLSDRGRAHVYWLTAEAHQLAQERDAQRDALAGFLVAAEVLPSDDELRRRQGEARAVLLAHKVRQHPALGKSPDAAIRLEDPRDADGVVAELGCVEGPAPPRSADAALEVRHLVCGGRGAPQVLWFDVRRPPR